MNITKGKLKQIIKNTIKEEYTEREVTQDFSNPDAVRAARRGWYDRGVLDGKNSLESDTNQFGEQYSSGPQGGWNAKHGKPPVEYLDGYNDGSGGLAEEHYEEKVLQNRDDMLAQKANMKEGTVMNITKGRLKQIIQEELSRVEEESTLGAGVADFDGNTGAPLTAKGWKIAASNPKHRFHKQAKEKLSAGNNDSETEQDWKNRRIVFRDTFKAFQALQKILHSARKSGIEGAEELFKKASELDADFQDNYAPRWTKSSVEEAFGMHRFEPEESPTITVTEEELIEARHAAYYLIKGSLESGADSVSLEETVRRVYGYNVPSYILELFSDEE